MTDPTHGPVATALARAFASELLAPPPIPRVLGDRLRTADPWCWTTVEGPVDPYDHAAAVERLLASSAPQLTIAHAGHGRTSWAMHYQLRLGPIAVACQVPYGNVAAGDEDRRAVEATFDRVRSLLARARSAGAARLSDRVVLVATSGWHGSAGGVYGPDGLEITFGPAVFEAAERWLTP